MLLLNELYVIDIITLFFLRKLILWP